MSLPKTLARGVRRPIERLLTLARHSASYPFDTPLTREIHAVERRGNEKSLRSMRDLPGLEPPPRHGLPGLAYQLVRQYKPRVVVELGTLDGHDALAIGIALRDNDENGRLYLVAPRGGEAYESFLGHRAALGLDSTIVTLLPGHDQAREHIPRPIDLLLIDARRPTGLVEGDYESYSPLVRAGGLILFVGVRSAPEIRPFWRTMTRNHENHTVRSSGGVGIIRVKQN